MRPLRFLLLGGLALPLAASSAHADQSPVALHLATTLFESRPAPDSARILAALKAADDAMVTGRMSVARRIYRDVIQEQRDARQYAGTALWRLASSQVYDGDIRDAAELLDDLAIEAARFGDPAMELRATFEAAVLWQKAKRQDKARFNLERVDYLLQSPVIPEIDKARVKQRIIG